MDEKYFIFILAATIVGLIVEVISTREALSRRREKLKQLKQSQDQHDI
jgi:hypothetical protein